MFQARRPKHRTLPGRTTHNVAAALLEASRIDPLPPAGDAALVAATLAGTTEAFATLVERYDRAVYHLAYRTLRDPEEARDVAQEAFFKAYRSLHTFRPGAKFSTWIFSIAYHACCDRLAHRKRYCSGPLPERADTAPSPEQRAIDGEQARRLRAAVEALPEKYRVVVTLYHLQGKQYEEIAAVLGLPMGTVKTHLFRAKEQLRRLLTENAPERAYERR